jgi:single stranded DNA-binding protein
MTLLINKLRFSGNLGHDAEDRPYGDKKDRHFVTFSVAQSRLTTDGEGKKVETTVWLDCKAFLSQDQFDAIFGRLKKGANVYLEGHLEIEKKQVNGANRTFYNMVVKEFHFLNKPLRAVDNERTDDDQRSTPAPRSGNGASPAPRTEESHAGAFMPANF